MVIIFNIFFKIFFYPRDITVFAKKKFKILGIDNNSRKFFFGKNIEDSEPTKPQDPVINAIFI